MDLHETAPAAPSQANSANPPDRIMLAQTAIREHGETLLAGLISDEALVAEVRRRNAERGLDAPLDGQTWIGDRWVAQECGIGRCPEWQRGDVLHRHWRDQATGVSLITPDATQPGAMPVTTGEVKAQS